MNINRTRLYRFESDSDSGDESEEKDTFSLLPQPFLSSNKLSAKSKQKSKVQNLFMSIADEAILLDNNQPIEQFDQHTSIATQLKTQLLNPHKQDPNKKATAAEMSIQIIKNTEAYLKEHQNINNASVNRFVKKVETSRSLFQKKQRNFENDLTDQIFNQKKKRSDLITESRQQENVRKILEKLTQDLKKETKNTKIPKSSLGPDLLGSNNIPDENFMPMEDSLLKIQPKFQTKVVLANKELAVLNELNSQQFFNERLQIINELSKDKYGLVTRAPLSFIQRLHILKESKKKLFERIIENSQRPETFHSKLNDIVPINPFQSVTNKKLVGMMIDYNNSNGEYRKLYPKYSQERISKKAGLSWTNSNFQGEQTMIMNMQEADQRLGNISFFTQNNQVISSARIQKSVEYSNNNNKNKLIGLKHKMNTVQKRLLFYWMETILLEYSLQNRIRRSSFQIPITNNNSSPHNSKLQPLENLKTMVNENRRNIEFSTLPYRRSKLSVLSKIKNYKVSLFDLHKDSTSSNFEVEQLLTQRLKHSFLAENFIDQSKKLSQEQNQPSFKRMNTKKEQDFFVQSINQWSTYILKNKQKMVIDLPWEQVKRLPQISWQGNLNIKLHFSTNFESLYAIFFGFTLLIYDDITNTKFKKKIRFSKVSITKRGQDTLILLEKMESDDLLIELLPSRDASGINLLSKLSEQSSYCSYIALQIQKSSLKDLTFSNCNQFYQKKIPKFELVNSENQLLEAERDRNMKALMYSCLSIIGLKNNLIEINLRNIPLFSDLSLNKIFKAIDNSPLISKLKFESCRLKHNFLRFLEDFMIKPKYKTLEVLSLNENELNVSFIDQLFEVFEKCNKIKTETMESRKNSFEQSLDITIIESFDDNKKTNNKPYFNPIEHLSLKGCNLTESHLEGFEDFLNLMNESFNELKKVKKMDTLSLDLSCNKFGEHCFGNLGQICRNYNYLQNLIVSGNFTITQRGYRQFLSRIANSAVLHSLDLRGLTFSKKMVETLKKLIVKNKFIQEYKISIDDEALKVLLRQDKFDIEYYQIEMFEKKLY